MIRAHLIRRQIFFKYRRHYRGLTGGKYAASAVATFGGGSVKLQALLADGSTWQSVSSGTDFSAAGYATVDLPPGQYRFTIATATAVFAAVTRVPY